LVTRGLRAAVDRATDCIAKADMLADLRDERRAPCVRRCVLLQVVQRQND
jgi:hypothetical protein